MNFLKIFRLCCSFFLSLAILIVGTAGAIASVQSDCLMPHSEAMVMSFQHDQTDMSPHQDMPCEESMQQSVAHKSNCVNDQKCIMYHVQILAFEQVNFMLTGAGSQLTTQNHFVYQNPFIPLSATLGIWRPPRML